MSKIKIELPPEQISILFEALAQMPYRLVAALIADVSRQIDAQKNHDVGQ